MLKDKVKPYIEPVVDIIIKGTEFTMTIMLVVMMVSIAWQVFTRFVLDLPAVWTEEVARCSFIYMAMFGAAIGVKNSDHFGMTLLTDLLEGKIRDIYFRYVINIAIVVSSLIFLFYGIEFVKDFGFTRVSPTFRTPMAWVFASVPIGAVLMLIFSLYNVLFEDFTHEETLVDYAEAEVKKQQNTLDNKESRIEISS